MKNIVKLIVMGLTASVIWTSSAYAHHDTPPKSDTTYFYMSIFQDIFEKIRKHYADPVNDKVLLERAMKGMVKSLDPHSSYLTRPEFNKMKESMNDSFIGIGVEITKDAEAGGLVKVVTVIQGSPSEKAGLKAGDFIVTANGVALQDKSLSEVVKHLRGPLGTTVDLELLRGGKPLTVPVTRGEIKSQTVKHKIYPNNIGYIRVTSFNEHVSDSVNSALLQIQVNEELKGLVLDFRGNPGGFLNEAIKMVDLFVKNGLIVSTKGRDVNHHLSENYAKEEITFPESFPIVILINGRSASASEIVAGSLQDLHRATVVGVKSYGKGSVQTIMPLPNGGALRITTAKYYTASGRTIHGAGIIPDIVVEIPKEYKPASENEIDPQLKKAFEIILDSKDN